MSDPIFNKLKAKAAIHNKILSKRKQFIKEYVESSEKLNKTSYSADKVLRNKVAELENNILKLKKSQDELYNNITDALIAYQKDNNLSYPEIEGKLRDADIPVYLITQKVDRSKLIPGSQLVDTDGNATEYILDVIITNAVEYYYEEIGIEHPEDDDIIAECIADNLERLLCAGIVEVVDAEETAQVLSKMIDIGKKVEDLNSY